MINVTVNLAMLLVKYRKMETFRVAQFSWNFAVGKDPRKLKSAKYFPSLPIVKAIKQLLKSVQRCVSESRDPSASTFTY